MKPTDIGIVVCVLVGFVAIAGTALLAAAGVVMGLYRRHHEGIEAFGWRVNHMVGLVVDVARCPYHVTYRLVADEWAVNDTPFNWRW